MERERKRKKIMSSLKRERERGPDREWRQKLCFQVCPRLVLYMTSYPFEVGDVRGYVGHADIRPRGVL